MRRRRKLPPDTRPKWDDPHLRIGNIWDANAASLAYQRAYRVYDSLPRTERDKAKYSLNGDFPGNPLQRIQTHHR